MRLEVKKTVDGAEEVIVIEGSRLEVYEIWANVLVIEGRIDSDAQRGVFERIRNEYAKEGLNREVHKLLNERGEFIMDERIVRESELLGWLGDYLQAVQLDKREL